MKCAFGGARIALSSTFTLRLRNNATPSLTWRRSISSSSDDKPGPATTVPDDDIARLAARPLHPLTLADLVKSVSCLHRMRQTLTVSRPGRPPLPEEDLYKASNFALNVLPTRLAHRIQALRNLPFIVVTNPNITKIHDNYMHSLAALMPYVDREVKTADEQQGVTDAMAGLLQRHSNTIPLIARGLLEVNNYLSADTVTRFLDEHLRARIGTRLIAEQQLALHYESQPGEPYDKNSTNIGVVDMALRPADIIRNCEETVAEMVELKYGVRPFVVIDGVEDARIAYIPTHIEYIVTELLKNSFRATAEEGNEREPIVVTIAPSPELPNDKALRNADQGESRSSGAVTGMDQAVPGVTIRIRDRGGGISPEHYDNLWSYGFTTFTEHEVSGVVSSVSDPLAGAGAGGSLAGLGYGLPLGRAYAEYFGGDLKVQTMWAWGTDVYLTLRGVGKS
jgi:hypothetical protein